MNRLSYADFLGLIAIAAPVHRPNAEYDRFEVKDVDLPVTVVRAKVSYQPVHLLVIPGLPFPS